MTTSRMVHAIVGEDGAQAFLDAYFHASEDSDITIEGGDAVTEGGEECPIVVATCDGTVSAFTVPQALALADACAMIGSKADDQTRRWLVQLSTALRNVANQDPGSRLQ